MKLTKHFNKEQFTCKCGCGYNNISLQLVDMLQQARSNLNIPFIITSGCRCVKHNNKEGGVSNSSHLYGLAVDIQYTSLRNLYSMIHMLLNAGFKRIGINFKQHFIHVDIDYKKPYPCIYTY